MVFAVSSSDIFWRTVKADLEADCHWWCFAVCVSPPRILEESKVLFAAARCQKWPVKFLESVIAGPTRGGMATVISSDV